MVVKLAQRLGIFATLAVACAGGCSTSNQYVNKTPSVGFAIESKEDSPARPYRPSVFIPARPSVYHPAKEGNSSKTNSKTQKDYSDRGSAAMIQSIPVPGLENFPGRATGSALYGIGGI